MEDDPLASAGDGSGESKWAGLESIVLEDIEDQLVLELGLCSSSPGGLLLSAPLVEDPGGASRVLSFLEVSEFTG